MPPMLSDSAVFESKLCEDTMSKNFGTAFAGLRQRYDPLSDHLAHDLWTATSVLERVCNYLICQAELRYRFWIESGVTKQTNDFSALRHPNRWISYVCPAAQTPTETGCMPRTEIRGDCPRPPRSLATLTSETEDRRI